ncbi:sensor histidine kinase, partial [Acidihalobacter prosperus]
AVKLFHAKNEDQLIGKSVYDLVGPQFHKTRQQNIQKALQNLTPIPLREEQFMRLDGEFFDGEVISVPIKFDDEFNIYSLVRDISERKSMRRQIIDIATNEQIRIGGEIHDGVGQELTALDLIMHRLERQATTKPSDINQIRVSLMELRRQLREAVKSVRLLAKGLSPAHMGPGGLPGELSRFAATVQKASDIQCQFTTFGLLPDLDKATAVHLYYMAQEAVNNALKHSSADKIDILYEYDGNNLKLSVADNGVGMEFSNTRKSGVGLMIMHYRADIIGATLSITSETKGTRILINLTHQYNE